MSKTIADALLEEGKLLGIAEERQTSRRDTLKRLLKKRFKKIPDAVFQTIDQTTNVNTLDEWLDNFARATRLSDVGIPKPTTPTS